MDNQFITFLHYNDLRTIIFNMLPDTALYMLYLSHSFFKVHTKVKHRYPRICMLSALKEKSLSYIEFILENNETYVFSSKEFGTIIKHDIEFVSSLVNSKEYKDTIFIMVDAILEESSLEVCIYLLLDLIKEGECIKNIVRSCRMDVIYYLEDEGINIYSFIEKASMNYLVHCKNSLEYLKYLNEHNYSLTLSNVCMNTLISNLEYAKWVTENIDINEINLVENLKYELKNSNFNIEAIFVLYNKGYNIINIIYDLVYRNNMVHRLHPHHKVHIESPKTIIHDASNNIFNIQSIQTHSENLITQYHIVYYLIQYNKFNLFDVRLFNRINNINNLLILCKKLNYAQFTEWVKYMSVEDTKLFAPLTIYNSIIDPQILKMYTKLFRISTHIIILLHKRGLIDVCHYIIDNIQLAIYVSYKISDSLLIYACKSEDIKLLRFIISKNKGINHIILKFCSLELLLELGLCSDDNFNLMLRYGNNEIVNYVLSLGKLDSYSLFNAWSNSTLLAQHVLKIKFNNKISLNMCFVNSHIDKKMKKEYYDWVGSLDFYIEENDRFFVVLLNENSKRLLIYYLNKRRIKGLDSRILKRVLFLDEVKLLKCFINHFNNDVDFGDDLVVFIIQNNLTKVLQYLISENKIKFPANICDLYWKDDTY